MPGPGQVKSSKKKNANKITAPSQPIATPTPTRDVPANAIADDPADPFFSASAIYKSTKDKSSALRALWDSAIEIGRRGGFEVGKRGGFQDGKEAGIEEGLDLGLEIGKREGKAIARSLASQDVERGFLRGLHQGQAEEEGTWVKGGHQREGTCGCSRGESVSIGVGTAPLQPTMATESGVQTDAFDAPSPVTTRISWADDSNDSLPIHIPLPVLAVQPPLTPRDFSGLWSGNTRPFGTLQRRSRRSRVSSDSHATNTLYYRQQRSNRFARHLSTSNQHFSTVPPSIASHLSWDQDPKLRDLSRALEALGWTKPG